jgi:hypothetical protein
LSAYRPALRLQFFTLFVLTFVLHHLLDGTKMAFGELVRHRRLLVLNKTKRPGVPRPVSMKEPSSLGRSGPRTQMGEDAGKNLL